MTDTMVCTTMIQRTAYTVIEGTKVVQHVCAISLENPADMRVTMTKLNNELYKLHRDVCRSDFAVFEDAAYQLQEEFMTKVDE